MLESLTTDYLIVGTGAMGMAFADTLLSETDAELTLVDLHAKPGGHWNDAYPFVTLHQPSAYYGVNSRELSSGRLDEVGLNRGLADLATGAEVSAYFEAIMRERFLPSGRVRYLPMCEYLGEGRVRSRTSNREWQISTRRKTVDATYLKTTVPATHTPNFDIDPQAHFIPLNLLPRLRETPAGYVVIGGGKTGIDACLWLLQHQVDPDSITWIRPRDAWLLDRRNTQADMAFFDSTIGNIAHQFEALATAGSVTELFSELEARGCLLRLDPDVRPSMFHGATVSRAELTQLRRIRNVVRQGRVTHLGADHIRLQHGQITTSRHHLHIDCSASAITNTNTRPVFEGPLITPQTVRAYQPVFSAAFIAHVEATYDQEAHKNQLCNVVPLPNHDTDWLRMMAKQMMNQYLWSQDKAIGRWLLEQRLDAMSKLVKGAPRDDADKQAILLRLRDAAMPAMANLQKLLKSLDAEAPNPTATSPKEAAHV